MHISRAQTIATAFHGMKSVRIEASGHGIRVDHLGRQVCFVREACFWSFLLQRISGKEASRISEIEARLSA